jgi:signal transduction histidine kinase
MAELGRCVAERYGGARVAVVAEAPDAAAAEAPDATVAVPNAERQADADRWADDDAGTVAPAPALAYRVPGDRDELDRLLVNLVDNAVRYAKSRVTVSVSRESGWIVLAVTDDGPGIPAADLERAFDRFARLDGARSRDGDEAGGAGLGLAIVRATAQAYGGTAHLEPTDPDAEPPGLRAVVRLPAATLSRYVTRRPTPVKV